MHRILNQLIVFFPGFLGDLGCASEKLLASSVDAMADAQGDKAETDSNGRLIPRYCINEFIDVSTHKLKLCPISNPSLRLFAERLHRLLEFFADLAASANRAFEKRRDRCFCLNRFFQRVQDATDISQLILEPL